VRLVRAIDAVGWIFVLSALAALYYGVKRGSHILVASVPIITTTAVYLLMLGFWSRPPGEIIDARAMFTMAYALVPLYVAIFAIVAHAVIVVGSGVTRGGAP
jgi:hypothetical protein